MIIKYETDQQLLNCLHQGDERAFEHVFHHFYKRICLYAENFADNGKEAQDIAEESFLRLWKSDKKFHNIAHLKSTLYQAARQIGINHQISQHRSQNRIDNYLLFQEEASDNQLQQIVQAEAMSELYQAIQRLPQKARLMITESYLEGKSNKEIADTHGLSIQTVKNQKMRALAILRQYISKETFNFLIAGHLLIKILH